MKRCFALLTLAGLLLSASAAAQIPNSGFETWIADWCVGWSGVNFQQTTDAHSGSYAIMGEVGLDFPFLAPAVHTSSTDATNPMAFPFTDRPGSFNGYYKF